MKDGKKVSDIYGTYAGYCDFNGERYYDARVVQNFMAKPIPETETTSPNLRNSLPVVLPSDCTKRADSVTLLAGDVESA